MPTLVSLHVWVLHKISVVVADVPFEIFHLLLGGWGSVALVPWTPFLLRAPIWDSLSGAKAAFLHVTQANGTRSGETDDYVKMKKKRILNNSILMWAFKTAQEVLQENQSLL